MLNTSKLLYVLPDAALVVELLPSKKPHSFAVQAFRQINGEYISEDACNGPNILKLFSKLEQDSYHLILPDDVFTNTIINVNQTSDSQISNYLKTQLLPSLNLSTKTHQIDTTVLTTFKGQSKVQLSALEQEFLSPIRAAAEFSHITISAISPLSWTVKALISLEPSVSVLQLGSNLYAALHYIGVDQALQAPLDSVDAIAETIRTLKGSEPNIQTIYLFTNTLIEEKLKELLSDAIPIQQLATLREDEEQLPSYLKEIVESGMKTLSISDYPVPRFSLGKATAADKAAASQGLPATTEQEHTEAAVTTEEETLPEPDKPELLKAPTTIELPATFGEDDKPEPATDTIPLAGAVAPVLVSTPKKIDLRSVPTTSPNKEDVTMPPETKTELEKPTLPSSGQTATTSPVDTVDLTQFAAPSTAATVTPPPPVTTPPTSPTVPSPGAVTSSIIPPNSAPPTKPQPIKNQTGVSHMLKMILITIVVFIVTVVIGIGIGVILLKMSNDKSGSTVTPTPGPNPLVSVSPTTLPTPTVAAIDKANTSVLVVNATTKAGYAGTIASKLTSAGYKQASTGNAKGDYASASADLVLMATENPALVSALTTDTGLSLTYSTKAPATEDPNGTYDAVIVLTQ